MSTTSMPSPWGLDGLGACVETRCGNTPSMDTKSYDEGQKATGRRFSRRSQIAGQADA